MDREFESIDQLVDHLIAVVLSDSRHLLRFCFRRERDTCRVFGPTTCHLPLTIPWEGVLGYVASVLSWELNDREVDYSFDHKRDVQYLDVLPRATECSLYPIDSLCMGDLYVTERSECNGLV